MSAGYRELVYTLSSLSSDFVRQMRFCTRIEAFEAVNTQHGHVHFFEQGFKSFLYNLQRVERNNGGHKLVMHVVLATTQVGLGHFKPLLCYCLHKE